MVTEINNKRLSIDLLLEAIYRKYDYDFRDYAKASISRRIMLLIDELNLSSITELQHLIIHNPKVFEKVFLKFAIRVTEMFRDPPFFKSLSTDVFPLLSHYPSIKIWHAGGSSGEEAYSLAILLKEHNLLEKTQLYSTDFNNIDLKLGRTGTFNTQHLDLYKKNYIASGGKQSLSDYYTTTNTTFTINNDIKKQILFANHNLVSDHIFGEMNIVICRNVLIYFSRDLQNKVIKLFKDSLTTQGVLCLGSKETLQFTTSKDHFNTINNDWKIYQLKKK